MANTDFDLANWMGLLPPEVRQTPIIYLAIPGSHNSMTYGINSDSQLAPDAEESVRRFYGVVPCIVRRWSKTQSSDAIDQLNRGIRFFDLRVCTKHTPNNVVEIFYCHALYSFEVTQSLKQINEFLNVHPKEFVILDFQHFYDFSQGDHVKLHNKILEIFKEKLYKPSDGALEFCSLTRAEGLGRQVLVIYRGYIVPFYFWASHHWPTPWPNTDSISNLKHFLEDRLKQRSPGSGYVTQLIITPTPKFIALRTFSSLKGVAKKVLNDMLNWLKEQRPGPFVITGKRNSNVFIADFIDIRNSDFCRTIIDLNKYLTNEAKGSY